jgi:uncharacterized protein YecT (DUF1311 family)
MTSKTVAALALTAALAASPALAAAAAPPKDPTEAALDRCLNQPTGYSTAGQTDCEAQANRAYDRRMNVAYAALIKTLPAPAAQQLRQAQRAWLAFQTAERTAAGALYATRQGTMYVPMAASSMTNVTRDRALQLEGYVRVMRIEG